MADSWLIDKHDGMVSTFEYDEMTDTAIVKQTQDVNPILERNKKLQNEGKHRTKDKALQLAASIPNIVVHQWMIEDGVNWLALPKHEKHKYLRRKLNDPQYRYLKVSEGAF